ncbi:VRR-NUC domain-containing protein [Hoylesella shahii]|uniref:VRR-NUC domain-containing protein n=1 Tax=Hoylesella shahii TaxID=228603 RepID=UPI002353B93A|nr:VRR-NUC domain-containing protein [Hoylesella shahii]
MITKSTLDILRDMADEQPRQRQRHSDQEHRLQCACVQWFRTQHPKFNHNLFAVPNGGRRDKVTGAKLKAEGVLAGVADLILLKSNADYGALLIEMKTGSGKQSEVQGRWQKAIEKDGYKYVLCRSLDDFMREINAYLKEVQG